MSEVRQTTNMNIIFFLPMLSYRRTIAVCFYRRKPIGQAIQTIKTGSRLRSLFLCTKYIKVCYNIRHIISIVIQSIRSVDSKFGRRQQRRYDL